MLRQFFSGCIFVGLVGGQAVFGQIELANLREDVRGLTQRVGELALRVEQLERENNDLRQKAAAGERTYVTLAQLNDAIGDVNRNLRSAIATSKSETLKQVGADIEKLAALTDSAIESLAKSMATRPTIKTFSEDFPKQGVSYTVQKGDTLADIAKKTGAKTQDIINANKITDPSRIQVGQTLFIPGGK